MTAEIAIMNKLAVALAADSAATIAGKVFNSANKLFALSKSQPVGIMIYGNAEFLRIPWDTIVKRFRATRGPRGEKHVADYARALLDFLVAGFEANPEEDDAQMRGLIDATLLSLRARVIRESRRETLADSDHVAFLRGRLAEFAELATTLPYFEGRDDGDAERCATRHGAHIAKAQSLIFGRPADEDESIADSLKVLSRLIFSKPISILGEFSLLSGFVIAGFGEDDLFPSLEAHELFGRENGQLLRIPGEKASITPEEPAQIFPFAQREMALTFLEGVNPTYATFLENALERTFTAIYPEKAAEALGEGPEAEDLKKGLAEIGQAVCQQMLADLEEHVNDQHKQPIRRAVAYLEREDLAAMAESLVNLTSLKQRFTLKTETVGGPVDVAIVSKGDGFIWMKRKHYFGADLNPDFFARSRGLQT